MKIYNFVNEIKRQNYGMLMTRFLLVIGLAVDVSSLIQISTTVNDKKPIGRHFDSRDYVAAFLRSDIKKLETVLKSFPVCSDGIKVSDNLDNCKKTRTAFEGLLGIFKKLDFNYKTYSEFGYDENRTQKQTKFKIVTRPPEKPVTSADSGPGVIKYVLCFVQSSRVFKSCVGTNNMSDDEETEIVYRGAYQTKFKKVTRPPEFEEMGSKEKQKHTELMTCINKAYGIFQTCVRGKEKHVSSEENDDPTYRALREELRDYQ